VQNLRKLIKYHCQNNPELIRLCTELLRELSRLIFELYRLFRRPEKTHHSDRTVFRFCANISLSGNRPYTSNCTQSSALHRRVRGGFKRRRREHRRGSPCPEATPGIAIALSKRSAGSSLNFRRNHRINANPVNAGLLDQFLPSFCLRASWRITSAASYIFFLTSSVMAKAGGFAVAVDIADTCTLDSSLLGSRKPRIVLHANISAAVSPVIARRTRWLLSIRARR
jgi:hypothetical protein